jgi:hypothetical protein
MYMAMSLPGFEVDDDTPMATGAFVDGRSHMTVDFGVLLEDVIDDEEIPEELEGTDLTMELISDGTDLYLRSRFFAVMAAESDDDSIAVFRELGDTWGFVDGTSIPGLDAASISQVTGIGGADPSALFDLLADVEGAESIGTDEIGGVSVIGVRAEVNLDDLLAAQGATPALSELDNPFGEATFPIELWIDKDGLIRRWTFELTPEAMAAAVEAAGESVPPELEMELSVTMDLFDYGADDIVVEVPTEFVDITDEYIELMPENG